MKPIKITHPIFSNDIIKHYRLADGRKVKVRFDAGNRVTGWKRSDGDYCKIKNFTFNNWAIRDSLTKSDNKLMRKTITHEFFDHNHPKRYFKISVLDLITGNYTQKAKMPAANSFYMCSDAAIEDTARSMIKSLKNGI